MLTDEGKSLKFLAQQQRDCAQTAFEVLSVQNGKQPLLLPIIWLMHCQLFGNVPFLPGHRGLKQIEQKETGSINMWRRLGSLRPWFPRHPVQRTTDQSQWWSGACVCHLQQEQRAAIGRRKPTSMPFWSPQRAVDMNRCKGSSGTNEVMRLYGLTTRL